MGQKSGRIRQQFQSTRRKQRWKEAMPEIGISVENLGNGLRGAIKGGDGICVTDYHVAA